MRILFLRHGETLMNEEKSVQGWSDSSLTAAAIKQTSELAESLRSDHIDYAYTSDLGRAVETCRIISSQLDIPRENTFVSKNFREYNYGYFEKRPEHFMHSKVKKHLVSNRNGFDLLRIGILKNKKFEATLVLDAIAALDKQFRSDGSDHSPDAEEFTEYANNAIEQLKRSLSTHPTHNAIVVSHGHLLMTLLAIISPDNFKKKKKLNNLEGYELDFHESANAFTFSRFIDRNAYQQ